MDTKQLLTGKPREGFYPVVQDTVTVIELNEAVMNLTSESNSEEIIAAFDDIDSFNTLVEQVRDTENIVNGILMNNDNAVGKIICSIAAYKNQYSCDIEYFYGGKIIRLAITNTDGTLSCFRTESNIGGDKTNVLILSLENDLANGQKDSPVDAEVSTALKDAISTGKACVIKSANSDILANLQQTGDNVTIVMEQISRIGQTFVAVNTTITVNTATNVISDYQTGAIVLETEGDGSKFLSNDGSYKELQQIKGGTTIIGLDKTSESYPGIVLGELNEANGETSIAGGSASIASSNFSTAIGRKCVTLGNFSTALGYRTVARGLGSTALGYTSVASGDRAVSVGGYNLNIYLVSAEGTNRYYVNGGTNFDNPTYDINRIQVGVEIISKIDNTNFYTTVTKVELIDNVIYIETAESLGTFETPTVCGIGSNCAVGEVSFSANISCAVGAKSAAFGFSYAGGDYSFAAGDYSYAYGECSSTFGKLTESWNKYECSVGIANKSTQNADESIATRFTIGIGSGNNHEDAVRKNAVEIKANGDGYIIGIGNYDGTNAEDEGVKSLQEVLSEKISKDNVLAKDNTTEYTPANDYNPATKKYVDDSKTIYFTNLDELNTNKETVLAKIKNKEVDTIILTDYNTDSQLSGSNWVFHLVNGAIDNMIVTLNCYRVASENVKYCDIYKLSSGYNNDFSITKLITINIASKTITVENSINDITLSNINDLITYGIENKLFITTNSNSYGDNLITPLSIEVEETGSTVITHINGWDILNSKMIHIKHDDNTKEITREEFKMPRYQVVTESEYAALGTTPNTDNVLYFVTPD